MSNSVFILSASRTAVGAFQGALQSVPATRLGATAIQGAIQQAEVLADQVDQCIMGHVITAGCGQAPARQAALYAGLPSSVACMTINKVCGSGLKAVGLGFDAIRLNDAQLVVAGGQENMTASPHLLENSRSGYRLGPVQAADAMIKDGLWDPYNDFHMGKAAELCVSENSVSREAQDQFAQESYRRAQQAQKNGSFNNQIVPVEVQLKKQTLTVTEDEEPKKANFEKMPQLRPAFEKEGTITAANSSKINDGAAALVIASQKKAQELDIRPMARITATATFAQDPKWFTTAPVGAIKKCLDNANLSAKDIDLWEINEAFSVVTMVAMKELSLEHERVNVHGGAVALGHPIGCSGARILTTLVHALQEHQLKRGLATLCIGGGEAFAMIVERA